MQLVLASGSPRRAELLRTAGIAFEVIVSNVEEVLDPEETPDGYVRRVAQLKAEAVVPRAAGRPVLAADTIVVIDNTVLGKPTDRGDARRMLRLLAGREHMVVTGVCLVNPTAESLRIDVAVARTAVEFGALTETELDWYIASGEPMDKAGAYAIQGLAARFITRIDGSYSNVVGLPVALVYGLCRRANLLVF